MAPTNELEQAILEQKSMFLDAFQAIEPGAELLVGKFNELVGEVGQSAWLLGPAATFMVRRDLGDIQDALEQVIAKVKYALAHQVPVLSLISAGVDWLAEVKRPVSELSVATVRPDNMNFAKWIGDAANAYNAGVAIQRAAVDEVTNKAEFISKWLFDVITANVDYAIGLAKVVTDVLGRITQAVLKVGGVITIPWALVQLEESIGDIVEGSFNYLLTIEQRLFDALARMRDVAGQIADHSKFPNGKWPQMVTG
ncbi:hypothetical protein EV382_1081 [Micromonospora violae]|uniref:Uncharacterized protein n=1 Tax=Micromonospora violae TaxID=1278207 RepID=A0A4Q7UA87_9ACTN|nr:hypothetical protein [Micromonospora violae]RZT77906.1 hypothetical protein EV382_1081 [Micromonospora violae]